MNVVYVISLLLDSDEKSKTIQSTFQTQIWIMKKLDKLIKNTGKW